MGNRLQISIISCVAVLCFCCTAYADTWRAKIKDVSNVDSSGSVHVTFDVERNGIAEFTNLRVEGEPTIVMDSVEYWGKKLKAEWLEKENIIAINEVSLDD